VGADGATPSSLVSKGADIEPREVESSNRKEGHFAAPSRTCVPSSAASQFFATLPAFELLVTDGLNTVPIALELNSTFTGNSSASWFAGARWSSALFAWPNPPGWMMYWISGWMEN
jgi:hypothetical protein